jgi:hypothetical protein
MRSRPPRTRAHVHYLGGALIARQLDDHGKPQLPGLVTFPCGLRATEGTKEATINRQRVTCPKCVDAMARQSLVRLGIARRG